MFQQLNHNLFFLDFELAEEAYWVMENGSRICRGEAMHLEWWSPSTGCKGSTEEDQEVWIRVVGLPLHLWTEQILKKVGNGCGGYIALDKNTEQRKDLRWARILVKKDRTEKPSSANLLAGARSYELQIWWEIQPRVMEVYPRGRRTKDFLAISSGEDEGKTRAPGRVSDAKGNPFHSSREWQYGAGQWKILEKSVRGGGMYQHPKCAGNDRVGPKQSVGVQKNKGISGREEGDKQVILRNIKKGGLGRQTGMRDVQNLRPNLGTPVGQSPTHLREQTKGPIAGIAPGVERAKRTGLGGEKTEDIANYCLLLLQRSKDKAGDEKELKENTTTETVGQEDINNSERGLSRVEGRISREAKGKQKEEKGSSLAESERESLSGKFMGDTLSCAVGDVGWVEEDSTAGEMRKRSSQADDNRCNNQAERGSKPSSCHPSNPEENAKKLELEVEEGRDTRAGRKGWAETEVMGQREVTWLASSGRVQTYISENQVQKQPRIGSRLRV